MLSLLRRLTFWLLWAFVFTIPWEEVVPLSALGTVSRAIGLPAAALGGVTILLEGFRHRLLDAHLLALAFAAWLLASVWWSDQPTTSFQLAFTVLQLVTVLLLVHEFARSRQAQRRLLWAFVLGGYVGCLSAFQAFVSATAAGVALEGDVRFAAGDFNENYFGLTIALGVPMAWYLASTAARRAPAALARGYVVAAVLAVFLTGSRGGLLALLAALTVVPLARAHQRSTSRATVLVVAAAALLVIAVVPDATLARVQTIPAELSEGDLNARQEYWRVALDAFVEDPWLGQGAGGSRLRIMDALQVAEAPHNTFLSVVVDTGIVGLALFCLLLLSLGLRSTTLPALEGAFARSLLLTLLVAFMPAHWELRKATWLVMAFLLGQYSALRPSTADAAATDAATTDATASPAAVAVTAAGSDGGRGPRPGGPGRPRSDSSERGQSA